MSLRVSIYLLYNLFLCTALSQIKPGGYLVFSTPFIQSIMPYPTDYYRFTAEGNELLLKKAGFEVTHAIDIACFRMPVMSVGSTSSSSSFCFRGQGRIWLSMAMLLDQDAPDVLPSIITTGRSSSHMLAAMTSGPCAGCCTAA
jgi:hypothetical protein